MDADAATAEDDLGDRHSPRHVVVGGDQVNGLDIKAFKIVYQSGEVGDGIDGAIVQMQSLVVDFGWVKNVVAYVVGGGAGRDPNGEMGIFGGEVGCFPFSRN